MSDIVQRLQCAAQGGVDLSDLELRALLYEAAGDIKQLRDVLEIEATNTDNLSDVLEDIATRAHAALAALELGIGQNESAKPA